MEIVLPFFSSVIEKCHSCSLYSFGARLHFFLQKVWRVITNLPNKTRNIEKLIFTVDANFKEISDFCFLSNGNIEQDIL